MNAHPPSNTTQRSCKQPAGQFEPVIDRNRCEGKGPCVDVCPTQVLAMGVLSHQQRGGLSWKGRLKALAHGHRQAFAINSAACEACGLCVAACPEKAITLRRAPLAATGTGPA